MYFCQRCLNHKEQHPRKDHKPLCRYCDCTCSQCQMVEKRRILNKAINIRKPDEGKQRIQHGSKTRKPKCTRCAAHGADSQLKGHKNALCPYWKCRCSKCTLVMERRLLMADQMKLRRRQKMATSSLAISSFSATPNCLNDYLQMPLHQPAEHSPALEIGHAEIEVQQRQDEDEAIEEVPKEDQEDDIFVIDDAQQKLQEEEEGQREGSMEIEIIENPRDPTLEEKLAKATKKVYKWMAGIAPNEIGRTIGDWDKLSLLKIVEMADHEIREHPQKLNVWLPWLKCAIPKCSPKIEGAYIAGLSAIQCAFQRVD